MKTVCDLVNEARVAGERAKAKLLLQRTGAAGPIESPEIEVDRVLSLLPRIEELAQKAAAHAMAKGSAVASMLTPTGKGKHCDLDCESPCGECCDADPDKASTTRIPRMGAVVITDVIDGTFSDLRERIENGR